MTTSPLGEFWRLPRLEAEIGAKKSYIYLLEKNGKFPKRIKLGRASVWSSAQVEAWKRAQAEGKQWTPDHA